MNNNIPVYASISADGGNFSVAFHHTIGMCYPGTQNGAISGYSLDTIQQNSLKETPLIDWRPADPIALIRAICSGRGPLDRGINECAPGNQFSLKDLLKEAKELGANVTTVADYVTDERLDCRIYMVLPQKG